MSWPWIVAVAALAALVLVQFFIVIGVVNRSVNVMDRFLAHLQIAQVAPSPRRGAALPDLDLFDADEQPADTCWLASRPFLLLVVSPACPSCERLLRLMGSASQSPVATVVMITDISAAPEFTTEPLPPWVTVLYQRDHAATRALGVDRTPIAIVYDDAGRVTTVEVPTSVDDLIRLSATVQFGV